MATVTIPALVLMFLPHHSSFLGGGGAWEFIAGTAAMCWETAGDLGFRGLPRYCISALLPTIALTVLYFLVVRTFRSGPKNGP